jgi:hypothetical protein
MKNTSMLTSTQIPFTLFYLFAYFDSQLSVFCKKKKGKRDTNIEEARRGEKGEHTHTYAHRERETETVLVFLLSGKQEL